MVKFDKLIDLAASIGLDIMAFEFTDFYECVVRYLNPKKAGKMPVEEFCRDRKDYELRMKIWIKDGTEFSPKYSDFDSLLAGELKRLKEISKNV